MTNKSRRQRGSRTHGGGSHKNRRGAGHRGGRGRAGRDKHEFHNYGPLGKHGFSRPEKVKDDVKTINVQRIDEDIALWAAEGLAEQTDDGYRVDVRDVVEDGWEADTVKVLGTGQVHHTLEVIADEFSNPVHESIEEEGGRAISDGGRTKGVAPSVTAPAKSVTGLTLADDTANGGTGTMSDKNGANSAPEFIRELHEKVKDGELLAQAERDRLLDDELDGTGAKLAYDTLIRHYRNVTDLETDDVVELYQLHAFAQKHDLDTEPVQDRLDKYFDDLELSEGMESFLTDGLPESIEPDQLPDILQRRREIMTEAGLDTFGQENAESVENTIERTQKEYLYLIRNRVAGEG